MKICDRALNRIQIINGDGDVKICGWQADGGFIGRLTENSLEEIYNSNPAKLIRERHLNHDFSNCNVNACPYIANGNVEDIEVDVDRIPNTPKELQLGYENVCNYHCVTCTIPDCMIGANREELEEKWNKIDNEILPVLPYIKKIGANGLGELFVSRHILKILSEWKPLANPSEVSVSLETNGSLFNEKNWSKIRNLGQYNLSVSITVMSFEEKAYQYISGTKLPISNIESNLRFVKKLREEGTINYLELATVYQERNFRTLPEFTRRCIEEFGADCVRLRPFEPWVQPGMKEWFMDVRNSYHPYHEEFVEIMKAPIFKHPKVFDWGGGRESGLGPEPNVRAVQERRVLERIITDNELAAKLKDRMKSDVVIIYALDLLGQALVRSLKDKINILYAIERAPRGKEYSGIPIYSLNDLKDKYKDAPILVSLVQKAKAQESLLRDIGYSKGFYNIGDLL